MSRLCCIDAEMTGPRVTRHAMINLGVTILDLNSGQTLDQLDLVINVPEGRMWDETVRVWMLRHPRLADIVGNFRNGQKKKF